MAGKRKVMSLLEACIIADAYVRRLEGYSKALPKDSPILEVQTARRQAFTLLSDYAKQKAGLTDNEED